jgi:hypothetical protein
MNNAPAFRFRVDVSQAAALMSRTREEIEDKVVNSVEMLSIAAHAYITNLANTQFAQDDFKRQFYLGLGKYAKDASGESTKDDRIDQSAKNLRWIKVADGIWVVELDERAQWLEEGRAETFMGEWLLKPGAKGVKRAKDGSLYRAIPFKQTEGKADAPGTKPLYPELIRKQAARQKISLTKIEKNADGSPKLGVLHKLDMKPTSTQAQSPDMYSKPRSIEDALKSGLKPHSGIYKLEGAVVTQRQVKGRGGKTKVKKETVVFRVISSKHKAEHRWFYPTVKPLNAFGQAYEWANKQWETIIKQIEMDLSRT